MSLFVLSRDETATLLRIAERPMPACDVARETLEKLSEMRLVRVLLGHCSITPRGQLEIYRQRFRHTKSAPIARVSEDRPLLFHEATFAPTAPDAEADLASTDTGVDGETEAQAEPMTAEVDANTKTPDAAETTAPRTRGLSWSKTVKREAPTVP